MGIFSFLTGNKKEGNAQDGRDRSTATVERPEAGAERPAPGAQRPDPGAERPAPSAQRPDPPPLGQGPLDQPFTPPEAWNVDALLQPPPQASGEQANVGAPDAAQTAALQGRIIEVIKTVYDPEIPVDIYELGLIYDIIVDADRKVLVKMTLTSPACPSAQQIPSEVRYKVKALPEVTDAWVDIVWEPPWDKDRMSEAAKMALGIF